MNRELTPTPTIAYDYTTPGQVKANIIGGLGGAPLNSIVMPNNADDEQDLLDAYDDLPAGGGMIFLPDAPIALTAFLELITKPVKIFNGGPNSALVAEADIDAGGTKLQIGIGGNNKINGVELAGFEIRHDRALGGSSMRTLAISIAGGSRNIHLHHLRGTDLTSDWIIVRPDYADWLANHVAFPDAVGAEDIRVHDCVVTEYYESWINLREGVIRNLSCFNNEGNVSAGHPGGGSISRPYGLSVALENSNGLFENCSFSHNTMNNTMASNTNSLGMLLSFEDFLTVMKYNRVSFHANTLTGWWTAARLWMVRIDEGNVFPGNSNCSVTSNRFLGTTLANIPMGDVGGKAADHLLIYDNEMDTSLGASGLTGVPPPLSGGSTFMCTINSINNRNI